MYRSLLLLLGLLLLSFHNPVAQERLIPLHSGWQLEDAAGQYGPIPATVPGVVQLDLLNAGLIPDPFRGTNEDSIQWVGDQNWTYTTSFDVPAFKKKNRYELRFEGLDTYARVFLNGQELLRADNMFRSWMVDVGPSLKAKGNRLEVQFQAPADRLLPYPEGQLPYHLTAANDAGAVKLSPYVRKAPYQFGWDWAPRLLTQGIWRPVYLLEYGKTPAIRSVEVLQETLDPNRATLKVIADIEAGKLPKNCRLQIWAADQLLLEQAIDRAGTQELSFELETPKLWWPHSIGEPYRYHFEFRLLQEDRLLSEKSCRTGLRTVELVQEGDAERRSFYFKINGKPVFAKGANYIPGDPLLPRYSEAKKRQVLEAARAVNMNMIRVWGGGIYESDAFYDYCDSLGLMVWQDFMFACSMYPDDPAFLENVEAEARENIRRLRRHPSIVHWCGNNEVDVAWNNWGWQKAHHIHGIDSVQMAQAYPKIFKKLLPELIEALDPQTPYSHTSPLSNWGKDAFYNRGSMHYWGVWHGPDNFDGYEKYVGRFVSEYGFQSFPALSTILSFAEPGDLSLESKVMQHHQKSYIGNGLIREFMEQYYRPALSFADFVYKSQLTQAEGYRRAIRAHRWDRNQCMGSLYWQLNDTWPAPSWSSIDYYGNWKAVHYALRELYADLLILPKATDEGWMIGIASDRLQSVDAELVIQLRNLAGEILKEEKETLTVDPETTTISKIKLADNQLEGSTPEQVYYDIQLLDRQGGVLAATFHFLRPPKDIDFLEPTYELHLERGRNVLNIHADTFVKGVYLTGPEGVHFEKNFFDLPAHTIVEVPFTGPLRSAMQVRLLHCNQR